MNQLEQIRIEKHKDFLRKTWLPLFFEKYKSFFSKEALAKKTILKAIKKHFLPDVLNKEFLEYIPGIYRMRVKLTPDNLVKPKPIEVVENKININNESDEEDEEYYSNKKNKKNKNSLDQDADINQVIEESLKEYNDTFDKVLSESIKDNNDVDYDEYILNQAILDSINCTVNTANTNYQEEKEKVLNQDPNIDVICFHIVIDIRDFYPNPTQPLLINDMSYFL